MEDDKLSDYSGTAIYVLSVAGIGRYGGQYQETYVVAALSEHEARALAEAQYRAYGPQDMQVNVFVFAPKRISGDTGVFVAVGTELTFNELPSIYSN